MADEFNMEAAVDAIGGDLGFGGEESDSTDDSDLGEGSEDIGDSGGESTEVITTTPAPAAPAETSAVVPRTWRPEAAATWAQIPPAAQAEILKREQDIFAGLEQSKTSSDFGKSFQTVLDPYMPLIKQHNLNPVQLTANLLQAHHTMAMGTPEEKRALFTHLASSYGIDLSADAGGEPPYVLPEVSRLTEQNKLLQSRLDRIENTQNVSAQRQMDQVQADLTKQIDAFASDPSHPYFNECGDDIVAYLKTGATLEQAYEKAVWANPVTRAKEIARSATEAKTKADAEAAERAKKAREATGANLRSSAKPGRAATPQRGLDKMTDTLSETFKDIVSRSN